MVHFKAEESDDRHSRFQPGGHAGQRIFNYDAVFRLKSHAVGGQQKQIRFRFAVFDHIGGKYFVFAEITADADRLYLGQRFFLDAAGSDALPQTGVAEDIFDSFRQFYAFFQQFVISVQRFFPERVVGDNAEPVKFFFFGFVASAAEVTVGGGKVPVKAEFFVQHPAAVFHPQLFGVGNDAVKIPDDQFFAHG